MILLCPVQGPWASSLTTHCTQVSDQCPLGLLLTSPLKLLNGIQRNLTGSKISTSSTKFVFFGPIGKTRWPPWPLISWDIFDFPSETTERNSRKLIRKQDLNVLYQVCVLRADQKNKMAALASDWLRHFLLLLWNRLMEFNETSQEARSQRPLPSLCFSGQSEKTRWPPWPLISWDIFNFSSEPLNGIQGNLSLSKISTSSTKFVFFGPIGKTRWLPWPLISWDFLNSPLKPLNGIQRNLTESKISTSSTKFVFFEPIGKTRWLPCPLIGWDIFNFFSETVERNSTKLDRRQDINILYQVCVFRADGKNKMALLASDWLRHFWLLRNRLTEFNETWQEARSQHPLPSLCFSGQSEKQDGRCGLWLAETFFEFSSETTEWNSTKLDRKQDLNVLYQVCVFWADQ